MQNFYLITWISTDGKECIKKSLTLQKSDCNSETIIFLNLGNRPFPDLRLIQIYHILREGKMYIFVSRGLDGLIWPGPGLNIKTVSSGMGIPMLMIRRSQDRFIFNMGILILVRPLYIETPLLTVKPVLWMQYSQYFDNGEKLTEERNLVL